MRQPLEDGVVSLSPARGTIAFPATFMLVSANTRCPCVFYGDHTRLCARPKAAVTQHQWLLSGPLLNTVDVVGQQKATRGDAARSYTLCRPPRIGRERTWPVPGCATGRGGARPSLRCGRWAL